MFSLISCWCKWSWERVENHHW